MKKNLPIFLLLGGAAIFIFALVELFELRFEEGDVYPPYSSLRADPLGTMAFYESLEKISGLAVSRDLSQAGRLPETAQTVYLHLAGNNYEWEWLPPEEFHELQNFLARGNRLVITFFPETEIRSRRSFEDETNAAESVRWEAEKKKTVPRKPAKKMRGRRGEESYISLFDRWNFHAGFQPLAQDGENYAPARVTNSSALSLPAQLEWHGGGVFTNLDAAWKTIYSRGTNAVVIERFFGGGSVVVASDSYFISNEAMAKDRHPELLAWLVDQNKNIVFDEAHLGIVETPGVAALMRKYRLHALAAGLLLLAGLFIWKNSTSLVPPRATETTADFVAGRDSASGFINLLRRSIPPRDLLATGFAEWKKTAAPGGKFSSERLRAAEAIFLAENSRAAKERDPFAAHKKISETLGPRKNKL